MIQSSGTVPLKEYGGYYYYPNPNGTVAVQLPGANILFTTLPNYDVFVRFVDQCNGLFASSIPQLQLHLTGCKRCAKSLDPAWPDFFSPCRTGSVLISEGKAVAQHISKVVADDFNQWWASEHPDSRSAAEGPSELQ